MIFMGFKNEVKMYCRKTSSSLAHLLWVFFAAVIVFIVLIALCLEKEYSTGHRDGYLQKISNRGLLWKTWEAEVAMPGWRTNTDAEGNGTMSNVWDCSIIDDKVVEDLQKLRGNQLVRFHYKQVIVSKPWVAGTT